jgi:hypothetical protein
MPRHTRRYLSYFDQTDDTSETHCREERPSDEGKGLRDYTVGHLMLRLGSKQKSGIGRTVIEACIDLWLGA